MVTEVRDIKNPKTIMVKPIYAKKMKMIGPETNSGAEMLKSYSHKSWKYVCLMRDCKLIVDFNI